MQFASEGHTLRIWWNLPSWWRATGETATSAYLIVNHRTIADQIY
jgi:hypothetical protein